MTAPRADSSQRSPRFGFKRRVEVTVTESPEPAEEPPPPLPTNQGLPPLDVLLSLVPFSPSIDKMEVPPLEFESAPQVDWPDPFDDYASPIGQCDGFIPFFPVFGETI
jgi:hypothetical protein